MQNDFQIVEMLPGHAPEVARLHISGIATSFIGSLGKGFVTALYDAIARSDFSFGYVVKKGDTIVGFASFTTDLDRLYKSVIRKKCVRFSFLLARKILSLQVLRKAFETLFYPNRIKKMDLPPAEFLSMVIAPQARGKSLATTLVKKGFAEFDARGIKRIKIFAAVDIIAINKMYCKLGFDVVGQMKNHGVVTNVYVVPTNHFEKA